MNTEQSTENPGNQRDQIALQRVLDLAKLDNLYDRLGVRPDAITEEIKAAYRNLQRILSLNSRTSDPNYASYEDVSKRLNEAKDTLSDETARAAYDAKLSASAGDPFRDFVHASRERTGDSRNENAEEGFGERTGRGPEGSRGTRRDRDGGDRDTGGTSRDRHSSRPEREGRLFYCEFIIEPAASSWGHYPNGEPIPFSQMREKKVENAIKNELIGSVLVGSSSTPEFRPIGEVISDPGLAADYMIKYNKMNNLLSLEIPKGKDINDVVNIAALYRIISENRDFGGLVTLRDELQKAGASVEEAVKRHPEEKARYEKHLADIVAAGGVSREDAHHLALRKTIEWDLEEAKARRVHRYSEYGAWLKGELDIPGEKKSPIDPPDEVKFKDSVERAARLVDKVRADPKILDMADCIAFKELFPTTQSPGGRLRHELQIGEPQLAALKLAVERQRVHLMENVSYTEAERQQYGIDDRKIEWRQKPGWAFWGRFVWRSFLSTSGGFVAGALVTVASGNPVVGFLTWMGITAVGTGYSFVCAVERLQITVKKTILEKIDYAKKQKTLIAAGAVMDEFHNRLMEQKLIKKTKTPAGEIAIENARTAEAGAPLLPGPLPLLKRNDELAKLPTWSQRHDRWDKLQKLIEVEDLSPSDVLLDKNGKDGSNRFDGFLSRAIFYAAAKQRDIDYSGKNTGLFPAKWPIIGGDKSADNSLQPVAININIGRYDCIYELGNYFKAFTGGAQREADTIGLARLSTALPDDFAEKLFRVMYKNRLRAAWFVERPYLWFGKLTGVKKDEKIHK